LRDLPPVGRLLEHAAAAPLIASSSRPALTDALRRALAEARETMRRDPARKAPDAAALMAVASETLQAAEPQQRRRVVNATGIALHTNLGRAPLAAEAIEAAVEAGRGYVDLEFDLSAGTRGQRLGGIEALLGAVVGSEAAVAVNNCAAAVLLALSAHAGGGGEVIVSRGELVEIGGGFRVPDIIAQGGARLVEVGTTNRTRAEDYERAIGPATRMLLKVHRSNFRITGFTEEVSVEALAGLARTRGLVSMYDLGCGAVADLGAVVPGGSLREPTVGGQIASGCDLVAFSGDKLLGGPQAGIVAGTKAAVAPLRRHPLMRALRLDKMTLAALEATLRLYRDPARAARRVPVLRMLGQSAAVLEARAEALCRALARPGDFSILAAIEPSLAEAGGGTLPGETLESRAVSLSVGDMAPDALARALRLATPAIVGRVADGRVLLDMFAVADDEVASVAAAIHGIAACR
jgi:L-seryl-tRNA(Ser) seleniumtransferase